MSNYFYSNNDYGDVLINDTFPSICCRKSGYLFDSKYRDISATNINYEGISWTDASSWAFTTPNWKKTKQINCYIACIRLDETMGDIGVSVWSESSTPATINIQRFEKGFPFNSGTVRTSSNSGLSIPPNSNYITIVLKTIEQAQNIKFGIFSNATNLPSKSGAGLEVRNANGKIVYSTAYYPLKPLDYYNLDLTENNKSGYYNDSWIVSKINTSASYSYPNKKIAIICFSSLQAFRHNPSSKTMFWAAYNIYFNISANKIEVSNFANNGLVMGNPTGTASVYCNGLYEHDEHGIWWYTHTVLDFSYLILDVTGIGE